MDNPPVIAPGEPARLLVANGNPASLVGRLERNQHGYRFSYLRKVLDIPDFQPLVGLSDLHRRYESSRLFALFRQRLMSRRRSDYAHYLSVLGLEGQPSDFEELARSEGRRAGDSIFLIQEPHVFDDRSTQAQFFVHGVRYREGAAERIPLLKTGEELLLRHDDGNPFNPRAILVTATDELELGWVPDVLVDYAWHVCEASRPEVRVQHVNGSDAPPNLRLLVRLTGTLPPGYRPFAGQDFEPLALG